MTIFSIILNYKNKDETLSCVQSLKACHLPDTVTLKIIVVDNASNDGIERALSQDHPDTIFLQTGANLGYTGGNNVGLRWVLDTTKEYDPKKSQETYILIINNDTTFDPHFIDELVKAAHRHPNAGILSPKIYFDPASLPKQILNKNREPIDPSAKSYKPSAILWYAGGNFDQANMLGNHTGVDELDEGQHNTEREITFASGCALFIPLPVLRQVKEFDNNLFMYFEDADLSFRIKSLGKEIWYIPQAKMWHKNAASAGLASPLQEYFTSRNRLYLAFKYRRFRTLFALIREAIRNRHLTHRWQGFRDFFLLQWGKGTIIK